MNKMMNLEFMCCVLYGMKHINMKKFKKNQKHKETLTMSTSYNQNNFSNSLMSIFNDSDNEADK